MTFKQNNVLPKTYIISLLNCIQKIKNSEKLPFHPPRFEAAGVHLYQTVRTEYEDWDFVCVGGIS
jgi:hypothetical protein